MANKTEAVNTSQNGGHLTNECVTDLIALLCQPDNITNIRRPPLFLPAKREQTAAGQLENSIKIKRKEGRTPNPVAF